VIKRVAIPAVVLVGVFLLVSDPEGFASTVGDAFGAVWRFLASLLRGSPIT